MTWICNTQLSSPNALLHCFTNVVSQRVREPVQVMTPIPMTLLIPPAHTKSKHMFFDLRMQCLTVHYPVNIALTYEPIFVALGSQNERRLSSKENATEISRTSMSRSSANVVQFLSGTYCSHWMTDRPRHQRRRWGEGPCMSCSRKISPKSGHVALGTMRETRVENVDSTINWDDEFPVPSLSPIIPAEPPVGY